MSNEHSNIIIDTTVNFLRVTLPISVYTIAYLKLRCGSVALEAFRLKLAPSTTV